MNPSLFASVFEEKRMADKNEQNDDLYGVLGLKKECTKAELKNAYKKLAMVIKLRLRNFLFIFYYCFCEFFVRFCGRNGIPIGVRLPETLSSSMKPRTNSKRFSKPILVISLSFIYLFIYFNK